MFTAFSKHKNGEKEGQIDLYPDTKAKTAWIVCYMLTVMLYNTDKTNQR